MYRIILRALVFALIVIVTFFSTKTINAYINSSSEGTKTTELATWAVPLTITRDGITVTRTFGGDPNASDGYDTGLDVPAAPPGMTYYTYFEIIQFPNYLEKDIRAWVTPYESDIDWTLKIINAPAITSTMTWDPNNLPAEGTFTLEGADGSIDMRTQNSVTFSGDKVLTIKYRYVPPVGGWAVPLTITGNGVNFIRTFGGHPSGTDGYDTGIDVPSAPPGFNYYACFEIPLFPNYLDTDIRAWIEPYETPIDWTLKVINATGKTTSLSWDPTNLPSEGTFILEGANGSVDMRTQNSITFSGAKTLTIKYRDISSITVTSPNGGELWIVGGSYDITWTSTNFTDPVKIEYSIDGGVTWISPAIAANTPNDGFHTWTVPNTLSNNCKVRISDSVDGDPSDVSDNVFTIAIPPIKPVVTSPQNAGQEFWVEVKVGSVDIPVTSLFGLNFDLNFTHTNYIDVLPPYETSVIAGDFLGPDILFFSNVDETGGKVSVGLTRKAGAGGVNGEGVAAKIKLISDFETPDKTTIDFSISNVTAIDPLGNPINLDPEAVSLVIQTGPAPVVVWPGDTNNDGIVNTADVLPIGLYFGSTGPARPDASIDWVGQRCIPWTPVNATYANADGNSIIETVDIVPISSNFGKTHSGNLMTSKTLTANGNNMSLTSLIKPEVNFISGDSFRIAIKVQDVINLFGLSFELQYSQEQYVSPISILIDPLLGSDVVSLIHDEYGKVSVGICRKYGQGGISTSGTVIQILMKGNKSAPSGTHVDLMLSNVVAIDPQGNSINFIVENGEFITSVEPITRNSSEIPTSFHLSQNYPNPFNPQTNILFQLPKKTRALLKIYDMLGQEICTLMDEEIPAGYHEVSWDGEDRNGRKMASGVYIYILKAGDFMDSKKMIFIQ